MSLFSLKSIDWRKLLSRLIDAMILFFLLSGVCLMQCSCIDDAAVAHDCRLDTNVSRLYVHYHQFRSARWYAGIPRSRHLVVALTTIEAGKV